MSESLNKSLNKSTAWFIVAVVTISAFALRLLLLQSTSHPSGLDGYFYFGQVREFLATGQFKVADNSPVLRLIVEFARFAGDITPGLKLFSATAAAFLCIPAYLIGSSIHGNRRHGLWAACIMAGSPSVTYLGIEMLRNLGSLVFFLWSVWGAIYSVRLRGALRLPAVFLALVCMAMAAAGHRSIAGLMILLGALWVLRRLLVGRRRVALLLGGMSMIGGVLLVFAATQDFRGILNPRDLERFRGTLAWVPQLPFLSATYRESLDASLVVELSLYSLLFFGLGVYSWSRYRAGAIGDPRTSPAIFDWLMLILWFPFWDLSKLDMGFRLQMLAAILTPFWILVRLPLLRALPWPRFSTRIAHLKTVSMIAVLLLPLLPLLYSKSPAPLPYELYDKLIGRLKLPSDGRLLCEQGLSIYYYQRTGRDASHYLPEPEFPLTRAWRLTRFIPLSVFARTVPGAVKRGHVQELFLPYAVVREDVFREMLRRVEPDLRFAFAGSARPVIRRPSFLRPAKK